LFRSTIEADAKDVEYNKIYLNYIFSDKQAIHKKI